MLPKVLVGTDYEVLYRNYNQDAFEDFIKGDEKEIELITYTSSANVHTVFEVIRDRFPKLETLKLLVGFKYPFDFKGKKDFISSMSHLKNELISGFWERAKLEIYFHNHCHIKVLNTENACITGSQNFTGPSYSRLGKNTNNYNNELILKLNSSKHLIDRSVESLFSHLLTHYDEYLAIKYQDFMAQNPDKIYYEIKQKNAENRLRNSQVAADEIDRDFVARKKIDDAYISRMLEMYIEKDKYEPPKIFILTNRIEVLVDRYATFPDYGLEEHIEDMLLVINDFEEYVGDNFISKRLDDLISSAKDLEFIKFSFGKSSWRVDGEILDQASTKLSYHVRSVSELIIKKQYSLILESIVEKIKNKLTSLSLHSVEDFINLHRSDMIQTICEDPTAYIEYSIGMSVDKLNDYASTIVSENLYPAEVFKYLNRSVEDNIQNELLYFSEELAANVSFDGFNEYGMEE